jgi:hypothetical protein
MAIRRINPDTGVLEEADLFAQALGLWSPVIGESGTVTRVNPDSGTVEEQDRLGQMLDIWAPKRS